MKRKPTNTKLGKLQEKEINLKLKKIILSISKDPRDRLILLKCYVDMMIGIEVDKRIKHIREISKKVYARKVSNKSCIICKKSAQAPHHLLYDPEVTVSVCNKCHWKYGNKKLSWWLNKIEKANKIQ